MALASQSVRPSVPRSSVALTRGRRAKQKRLLGVVLLAGICAAMTFWAIGRGGDTAPGAGEIRLSGSPAGAPGARPQANEPAATTPPTAAPAIPALTMGRTIGEPTGPASQSSSPIPPTTTTSAPPAAATPEVREPLAAQPVPTTTPAPTTSTQTPPATTPAPAGVYAAAIAAGDRAIAQGRPLEARTVLNRALLDPRTTPAERNLLRTRLTDLNQTLLFGPAQTPGDPFTETYRVVSGDSLVKISRRLQLITEPTLIARINRMANPNALRVGQTLKVVRGPFHAVVRKSAFRMDVYAGPTPSPSSIGTSSLPDGAEPGWTYICSFPVGLGEKGLTPIAAFSVKENSKLVNPHWVNPRTGERFAADDPKNPIGERWLGLEGLDENSRSYTGYGIHGTIDPDSIGQERSMGCVRMNSGDVELVYELLTPRVSVVKIVP